MGCCYGQGTDDFDFGHDNQVHSAVYSPNDARIVTAGDKTAKVWDAETGQELLTLKSHDGSVISAVYSPGGETGLININTCSQEELVSLSGIGVTQADRIIAARPYERVDDLVNARGIGQAKLDRIIDQMIV